LKNIYYGKEASSFKTLMPKAFDIMGSKVIMIDPF